jgi:hypothetical protein
MRKQSRAKRNAPSQSSSVAILDNNCNQLTIVLLSMVIGPKQFCSHGINTGR